MRDKVYNLLNKNLKEFNPTVLVICCIVFLSLVAVITYKVSSSYALFTDEVEGKKTITLHYEEHYDSFAESETEDYDSHFISEYDSEKFEDEDEEDYYEEDYEEEEEYY